MVNIDHTFFIQVISFLLLFVVLRKLLFIPLMEYIDKRQKHIEDSINEAEAKLEDAQKIKNEHVEQLKKVRNEAREIIEHARSQGEESKEEKLAEAKEEVKKMLERAEREITREKDKAKEELRDQLAILTLAASEKVLKKQINKNAQESLITEFIEEMRETEC